MLEKFFYRFHAFKSSEFVRNVSKLTSATAIAQLITISTAPVLYRIYEREQYGTLGMYMAVTGVLGAFSTFQYLQTILLEKEDKDAINALWVNRYINICYTMLVTLVLSLFYPYFSKLANNPDLGKWLWMIPVTIFFAGQNEIFKVWANRKKEYNLLALNGILLAIFTPLISIILGLLLKNETGLFVGLLVGQSLPAVILHIGLRNKYNLTTIHADWSAKWQILKLNKKFPVYTLPAELINRLSNQLPVFMLNYFAGPASVGVYNLTIRMLGLPMSFIGGAISTVFQQKATSAYHQIGNCQSIFFKTLKSLILISIVPIIVILLFGPQLFKFVFGEKWSDAGVYARILIFMMSLQLIISPLSFTFFIANKQRLDFLFHIGILITISISLYTGLHYFDFITGLSFFSISYCFWYLIYLFCSYKFSKGVQP